MATRDEKLKKLEDKKTGSDMTIITNGAPFIEALQSKIDELKKTLGTGVEVDAYDLIQELKTIQAFVPAVKELVESLDNIEIPEIPKSIEVQGLAEVTERFEKQLELLQKIANIKLPDVDVKVEAIAKENAQHITKEIKKLVQTHGNISELNVEVFTKVAGKIDNLIEVINENAPKEQSQAVSDYTPIRRVRKVGNRLVFDDESWEGRGGGGGGGTVIVTNSDGSGLDNSSAIYDGANVVTPKFKAIAVSVNGDNDIVAAVPGKKIRVLSYAFVSSGTVNAKWQSNATDLSGLMYFIANTGISSGYNPKGHFQTTAGETLQLNLSSGVPMGGHIQYIEVD